MALSGPVVQVMATEQKAQQLASEVARRILVEIDSVLRQVLVEDELNALKSKSPTLWDLIPTKDDAICFGELFLRKLQFECSDAAWEKSEVDGFCSVWSPFIGDRFEDEGEEDQDNEWTPVFERIIERLYEEPKNV